MMAYKDILNTLGLKATPQRLSLIMLLERHGHMTIEAIYQALKEETPSLSLSTVYNNLSTLSQKGIVREVAIAGNPQMYELMRHEHAHLVCRGCGAIEDMPVDFAAVKKAVTLPAGVLLEESDLIFTGLCARCAAKVSKADAVLEAVR
ncbi:MAG: Fur family transcriptional regulator [Campylobacterales bacterium]